MRKLITIFLMILSFTNNAFSAVRPSTLCDGKQVWGNIEKVTLVDKNVVLDAKLDTGAAMTSLSAKDIQLIKQNNATWVRFTVYSTTNHQKIIFTKPLVGTTHILKRNEEQDDNDKRFSTRPIIRLSIKIGKQQKTILVNLIDRSHFRYPMLFGRNALQEFNVLVDVSHNYLAN